MIFENRFKATEEMYKEYVYKVLCRGILVHGVIFSVIAGFTFPIAMRQSSILATVEAVCLLILICVMIFTPQQALKQLLKHEKSLLDQFYHLKTCSVLMIGKQNGILYVPGAFTSGNMEEFEEFILKNCKNLKRIEKR